MAGHIQARLCGPHRFLICYDCCCSNFLRVLVSPKRDRLTLAMIIKGGGGKGPSPCGVWPGRGCRTWERPSWRFQYPFPNPSWYSLVKKDRPGSHAPATHPGPSGTPPGVLSLCHAVVGGFFCTISHRSPLGRLGDATCRLRQLSPPV